MSHINKQRQADLAVDICNICVFTANLSADSLIHYFRYNWGRLKPAFQTALYRPKKGNPMRPVTTLMVATIFSVLSPNACDDSEKSMSIQEQTEARFRLNPHPEQAHHLRIKINDAPGPLGLVGKFGVGYRAENCSYVINRMEGVTANPEKDVETQIRQLGEFEYETVVYADTVLDEDYFDEGICHWRPNGFGAAFKTTGHPKETKFDFGDFLDNLIKKKTLTKYFWSGSYPYTKDGGGSIFIRSDGIGSIDWGENSDALPPERQKNLFSITITLEEVKS